MSRVSERLSKMCICCIWLPSLLKTTKPSLYAHTTNYRSFGPRFEPRTSYHSGCKKLLTESKLKWYLNQKIEHVDKYINWRHNNSVGDTRSELFSSMVIICSTQHYIWFTCACTGNVQGCSRVLLQSTISVLYDANVIKIARIAGVRPRLTVKTILFHLKIYLSNMCVVQKLANAPSGSWFLTITICKLTSLNNSHNSTWYIVMLLLLCLFARSMLCNVLLYRFWHTFVNNRWYS